MPGSSPTICTPPCPPAFCPSGDRLSRKALRSLAMRIVVVVAAGDDDDDVDCADQREQELQLYDLVALRSNDDAAHSQSLSRRVGESGADDGDDRPSPQNPNGAQPPSLSRFIPNISREAIRSVGQLSKDGMHNEGLL